MNSNEMFNNWYYTNVNFEVSICGEYFNQNNEEYSPTL